MKNPSDCSFLLFSNFFYKLLNLKKLCKCCSYFQFLKIHFKYLLDFSVSRIDLMFSLKTSCLIFFVSFLFIILIFSDYFCLYYCLLIYHLFICGAEVSLSYCLNCLPKYYVKFISFILGFIIAISLAVNHLKAEN